MDQLYEKRTIPPKHEPRDEQLRIPGRESPTKTGLRKRGQVSTITPVRTESNQLSNGASRKTVEEQNGRRPADVQTHAGVEDSHDIFGQPARNNTTSRRVAAIIVGGNDEPVGQMIYPSRPVDRQTSNDLQPRSTPTEAVEAESRVTEQRSNAKLRTNNELTVNTSHKSRNVEGQTANDAHMIGPMKSESETTLLNVDGMLQPHYARSIVSTRSEMTLGILDYYLHDADRDSENEPVPRNPSLQSFDFDLSPYRARPSPQGKMQHEDDRVILPSYRSNFLRKAFHPKLSTPPKKRATPHPRRRRSSLSICCQGEGVLEQPMDMSLDWSSTGSNSSPISPRNITSISPPAFPLNSHRRDSAAASSQASMSRSSGQRKASDATSETAPKPPPKTSSLASDQIDLQTMPSQHSFSGSSFDFVRSVRRRPIPLRESPPPLRNHGIKEVGRKIASCVRRVFLARKASGCE